MTPGLTVTANEVVAPVATITLTDVPPTEVWGDLANADGFQAALVDAVLDATRDRTFREAHEALQQADVDALYGSFRSLVLRTARGEENAVWRLLWATRWLGTGRSPFADVLGAARLFGLAHTHTPDRTIPTIEVRMTHTFLDEVRADQRRSICDLLATLAQGCDVRLVATSVVAGKLTRMHRADLPGVSDQCNTPPGGRASVDEVVDVALGTLELAGREVAVLRDLADAPAESRSYNALAAEHSVSRSRVRQCLSRLVDLGLVEPFDGPGGKHADLLPAGRAFVKTVDREIGRQRRLDESVSGTGKPRDHCRVIPREHASPPTPEDGRQWKEGPVDVAYLSRREHAAAAGSAAAGDITLVNQPLERNEDGRQPWWSYDADRAELVVAAEYHSPLQYWVCAALSLVDWRTWTHVLTEDRLAGEVSDDLAGLEVDELAVLRDARCLGYLKDADATAEGYIEALQDAGDLLRELTRKLKHGEYDDRDRFRGAITREALGLASTMVHLLDLAGVAVVREIRLPEFSRDFSPHREDGRRTDLLTSITRGAAIQSRYGQFAVFRQLFERREEKREAAMAPRVDAADPFGELLGSFVLVGPGVDGLKSDLREAFASVELHEDAPEIAVPIRVAPGNQRAAYATAVRRMCEAKNLEATREAVSLLEALTGSPYDAARALEQLEREPYPRQIHPDEVRYALATLPADRILPAAAPTVSKAVHALLTADRALTQTELADRAGISARSVRTHADRLEAFGLVEATDGGYRLALPFRKERGRGRDRLPWYLTPNRERDDYRDATEKGVLWEAIELLDAPGDEAVMDHLGRFTTLQIPPDVRLGIGAVWPWVPPVLEAVGVLAADEPAREVGEPVTIGAEIEQTSLGSPSSVMNGEAV